MVVNSSEGNMFLYNILNIDRNSNQNDIKNAYRNLAKKYHPDINENEGTDLVFKTIKIAYEVLSNEYTKRIYDNAISPINDIHLNDLLLNIDKDIKNAYLQDLSLSIEMSEKVNINLNYLIATKISLLTIKHGISPKDIESFIKKLYLEFEQKALKTPNSKSKIEKEHSTKDSVINIDTKKNNKSSKKILYIFLFILIVIAIALISNPKFLEEQRRNEEIRQQEIEKERLKQERIAEAQLNPDLYWDFTFASPNNDDTFYVNYAVDYSDRTNKDMYCVVVGVTANKNTGSVYYLDDSYDDGSILVELDDFKIGSTNPTSSVMYPCYYIQSTFPITTSGVFNMEKGETVYLLFEMYSRVVNDSESFKYKTDIITELLFE